MNEGDNQNGQPKTNGPMQDGMDTSGIELHNVFFDFNKSTLRTESYNELNYWVDLLKKYPALKIEIDGHTDSVGTAAYNQKLSLARAEAVRAYLVAQGVNAKRLVPKGFGATVPKASNATEEGRQRNRRTEFRFIKT
jgi:outer membrane protein OmpA-like peptidoglycan-associated protein